MKASGPNAQAANTSATSVAAAKVRLRISAGAISG
jgi:hypothetical protein